MSDITDSTDLEVYQGDTVSKTFTFASSFSLSGKTLTVAAKAQRGDVDNIFSAVCSITSQVATLTIPAATSAKLPRICDYELYDNNNVTYLTGKIYTRRRL